MIKPAVTAKRVQQIEGIREQLRKLAQDFEKDFGDRISLAPALRKDLQCAVDNLERYC